MEIGTSTPIDGRHARNGRARGVSRVAASGVNASEALAWGRAKHPCCWWPQRVKLPPPSVRSAATRRGGGFRIGPSFPLSSTWVAAEGRSKEAGIQEPWVVWYPVEWIPACAGMTISGVGRYSKLCAGRMLSVGVVEDVAAESVSSDVGASTTPGSGGPDGDEG